MGSNNHILRFSFECKVIYFEKLSLYLIQVNSQCLVSLLCRISYNRTPGTVIELKISASCVIKLSDYLLISLADILYQFFICGIKLSCTIDICRNNQLLEHLCRCRNRIFCHCIFIFKLLQKFEILHKRMCLCLNLSNQISIIQNGKFCIELHTIAGMFMFHTLKSPHKIKMPERSPELSICNHMVA